MLAQVLARRTVARVALAGLALGFALLAGLSLWGTVAGERAATQLRTADHIRNAWDQMLIRVSSENEVLFDYVRAPDQMAVELLVSSVGSATPTLAWLQERREPADARQVLLLSDTYATFTASLHAVVDAGRRGDHRRATAKAGEASLSAASLRKQLNTAIELERIRLGATLDRVNRQNQRLRQATLVTLGVDLVLLTLCAALLLGYQRRVERHARRSSHRAMHDALTGLPNRTLLYERVEQAVAGVTQPGEPVAMLMLDLNGFKHINDTMGHHCGDLLLKIVAQRLAAAVRSSDTVARLGGDEFAALLTEVGSVPQVAALAWRILDAIREPAVLEGEAVQIGASIGISVYPDHGRDVGHLLRHADAAMYVAKRGRLGVVIYPGPSVGDAPGHLVLQP